MRDQNLGRRNIIGDLWPLLTVAFAAFAVYAATLGHELVWDDLGLIEHIRKVTQAKGPVALLAEPFTPEGDIAWRPGFYRPLVYLSLYIDDRLAGMIPSVFHLTNVLLHVVASVLVVLLFTALRLPRPASFMGGLLFALHPVHTESVAWVSGRTDLWAAVFLLAATLLWTGARRQGSRPSLPVLLAAQLAFFLALLSKEIAFMLPPVLLFWDFVLSRREDSSSPVWRRNRLWLMGWAAAVCAALALRFGLADAGLGSFNEAGEGTGLLISALKSALLIPFHYIRLLVWPWPLNAFYTPDQVTLSLATAAAAVTFCALCLVASRTRGPGEALLGVIYLGGFLLPVLVPSSPYRAVMAERLLYLPSVGYCLIFSSALAGLGKARRGRAIAWGAGTAVVLVFAVLCFARARVWKDNVSFFEDLRRTSPRYALGHYNLGASYQQQGRFEDAIAAYREAVRVNPNNAKALVNLGNIYLGSGRPGEALTAYQAAVKASPDFAKAHYNLGILHSNQGRYRAAVQSLRKAIRLDPADAASHDALGVAYSQLHASSEAIGEFLAAIEVNPGFTAAHYHLGREYAILGKWQQAIRSYALAVRIDPSLAVGHYSLGLSYLEVGDRQSARRELAILETLNAELAAQLREAIGGSIPDK